MKARTFIKSGYGIFVFVSTQVFKLVKMLNFMEHRRSLTSHFPTMGRPLVIQFQVKHEQNIDCGGGYVKVIFVIHFFVHNLQSLILFNHLDSTPPLLVLRTVVWFSLLVSLEL